MRVLIVEDELVSRQKLGKIFSTIAEYKAVATGASALEEFERARAENKPFDLICLDVNMPGKDGTEVLYEIREIEGKMGVSQNRSAKVLMVTALKDKDTVITCIQAGCDGYLVKPFHRGSVVDKLKTFGFAAD